MSNDNSDNENSTHTGTGTGTGTGTNAGTGSGTTFAGLDGYNSMRTHFPSARVKKLMQSDEDIGKVAQATPLVVGRAVELFMCALVEKTLEESHAANNKKISVQMLKKVIDDNEEFDFVQDVCDKYLNTLPPNNNNSNNSDEQ